MNAPLPTTFGFDIPPEVAARLLPCPPVGWERPPLKTWVKLQVIIDQEGRCKATGERLGNVKNVQFDHRPAVKSRRYDPVSDDTWPSVNDPKYIEAILKPVHKKRTDRDKADNAKSVRIEKDKTARVEELKRNIASGAASSDFLLPKMPKPKSGRWPKGQKIRSGGFQKRRQHA